MRFTYRRLIRACLLFMMLAGIAAASPALAAGPESRLEKQSAVFAPILSEQDAALYREIFRLQEDGKWRAADRRIKQLENDILMGHVQFQRYMHPRLFRSNYLQLKGWLDKYADHPGARRVYNLAMKRRPKNYRMPRRPVNVKAVAGYGYEKAPRASTARKGPRPSSLSNDGTYLYTIVRRAVRRDRITHATKLLARKDAQKHLPADRYDELRAYVARGAFKYGQDQRAFELSREAAERSRKYMAGADWLAGLTAYRMTDYETAAYHFARVSASPLADDWLGSAGAFWAARSNMMAGKPDQVTEYLVLAAANPRTFYGLIAAHLLDGEYGLNFDAPALSEALKARMLETPAVKRAIALSEVGEQLRADKEFRNLEGVSSYRFRKPLLALAHHMGLAATQYRLATRLAAKGDHVDAAAYPLPNWAPEEGFKVDPALIFAFIRQESAFKTKAKSPAGARGLMQLLPSTASFMANDRLLRRKNRSHLYRPEFNLSLGQQYLQHLLQQDVVDGDLFRLAAAYNGGPGNLGKWMRRTNHRDDPLLFVESIPARETRHFIERVLANYWIYSLQLGRPAPSLDAVARGRWPGYQPPQQAHLDIRVAQGRVLSRPTN